MANSDRYVLTLTQEEMECLNVIIQNGWDEGQIKEGRKPSECRSFNRVMDKWGAIQKFPVNLIHSLFKTKVGE